MLFLVSLQPTIIIENGPEWIQYAIAAGTIGAALFAGWAAFSARASTRQAQALIKLERDRDERATTEALWHQARRLSVELVAQDVVLPGERDAVDVSLTVLNGSKDPLLRCRIKVSSGEVMWGPQLIGTLQPGEPVTLMTRLMDATTRDPNAFARVIDVNGNAWIADARGNLAMDDEAGLQEWIDDAAAFGAREMTRPERGTLFGVSAANLLPGLDAWRESLEENDESL